MPGRPAVRALGLAMLVLVALPSSGANAWMQEARKTPAWFTDGVMYQIQPRAFTPEGTLKAAEGKLAYLKDLGVTIVYLVPVMKMDASTDKSFWSPRQIRSGFDNPKNQYRIADYFHVDEEYGTDQDLKDFCAAAHKLGLKVIFDLVYLHCGPTAPFLKEHPDFTWWNGDGSVKKGPWRFPKLNFANPEVRRYFDSNVRCLLNEFGADGFRCDVGDGIPLDFWCDIHDTMDAITASQAVLLCEGYTVCNQYKGFDADYGWFPGLSAQGVRNAWTSRERECPRGAKFVNHYENHDQATDWRPRAERKYGTPAVDQILVWMFTLDGVPMLFTGNELADADERHSMFGKTPMDWSQLDREPGKSRHALVKRLAELRRTHPALTSVNGSDGLTWLDTTAPGKVSAFVRRGKGETVLVVQNWTGEDAACEVSFDAPDNGIHNFYLAVEGVDRSVRGTVAEEPILARKATRTGARSYALGPYGFVIAEVKDVPSDGTLPLSDEVARPKAEAVLKRLTLDEKVSLLGGVATMYLKAMPGRGIPREWAMSDCSHAMKPEHGRADWPYVQGVDDRSVVLPPLSALASTWNRGLAKTHGDVMGEQMRARGKDQMLGPGLNINRNALCGRNWEYMGEDPFLAAELAVPLVKAVQSHGVAATVKHFCLNNQELNRTTVDTLVDERTFHEIYLPAFRAAIVDGGALAVMTSYNKVNGAWASENSYLQRGILRDRFGFKGMIVTDWGGQHSTVAAALNGGNVEMHRGNGIVHFTDHFHGRLPLADAVRRGDVPEATVDEMALHVLYTMAKTGFLDGVQPKGERLTERHHAMARQIGDEAIVLLKNEDRVLPLDRKAVKRVVVLGMQSDLKVCGNGSSCEAHAEYEITPLAGLREYLGADAEVKLFPLGDEASPGGRPIRLPKEILETTKPNGGEAFVSRAWEVCGWTDGRKVWSEPAEVLGYADYPTGRAAEALRYHAKLRATETGLHQFLIGRDAKAGNATVIVNGKVAFSLCRGEAQMQAVPLKADEIFDVIVDVADCKGENALEFGWRPPSASAGDAAAKAEACKAADAVIVFTGTVIGIGPARECESGDLPDMREPSGHDREIAALLKSGLRNLVVVHRSGTPLVMPWADDCRTLVYSPYLGQEAGRPFARMLFGETNPSGRLAASWPKAESDTPVARAGTYTGEKSIYRERFYVGYRWYDAKGIAPRFPFGHGLSYTEFAFGKPSVETLADGARRVSVAVTNRGKVAGKEVVQLYVEPVAPAVERPVRELKGFAKTRLLQPGETETVTIDVPTRAFAFYDVLLHRWRAPRGGYDLVVAASSADLRDRVRVALAGDIVFAE